MSRPRLLQVAVDAPLRKLFDYLPPPNTAATDIRVGSRVLVPFGRRRQTGIVTAHIAASSVAEQRLKRILRVLDRHPCLPGDLLEFLLWTASYYHHPPGETIFTALPAVLRSAQVSPGATGMEIWSLTESGSVLTNTDLKRAPKQAALVAYLQQHPQGCSADQINARFTQWRPSARRLLEKAWLQKEYRPCLPQAPAVTGDRPLLNTAQQQAVDAVLEARQRFQPFLLDGVTGSGKTEVYLRAIEQVVAGGRQALVLLPEIGLTPQMVERFEQRLPFPLAVLHSGRSHGERFCAWQAAGNGDAPVVIGTRSAILAPLHKPGLIIVDEEHDLSYKQQDGLRYSARDLALVRGQRSAIPVLLGTATPSLESLHNADSGRYRLLRLAQRAGHSRPPRLRLVDLRNQPLSNGLSQPLLSAIASSLARQEQVLLFINRRGYAPVMMCHACGWSGRCQRCDAHLTYHRASARLRCHHCGADTRLPEACPECAATELKPVGRGTERIEDVLQAAFPGARTARVDRDSTRRKHSMKETLQRIHGGEVDILIGTQMLAKGHHFPAVTLVGVLDADGGLFSTDFRAGERMAQLLVQVAGRAGRGSQPGEVLIQTHHPDHPLLMALLAEGYSGFARAALQERQHAQLPPYQVLALMRAEAADPEAPRAFLNAARETAQPLAHPSVMLLGPVPSAMERRAGRYRAQLLVQAEQRAHLHQLLSQWLPMLEGLPLARKVRWSIDVDPQEMI